MKKISKQTLLLDDPKADEVLVKIVASGVCHTDATVLNERSLYHVLLY
ncbi:hypothetical protein ACEQPO_09935 [Bacillus sp. SL00103]